MARFRAWAIRSRGSGRDAEAWWQSCAVACRLLKDCPTRWSAIGLRGRSTACGVIRRLAPLPSRPRDHCFDTERSCFAARLAHRPGLPEALDFAGAEFPSAFPEPQGVADDFAGRRVLPASTAARICSAMVAGSATVTRSMADIRRPPDGWGKCTALPTI